MRILIILILFVLIVPFSYAALSCSIVPVTEGCAGQVIIRLTDADDAHAYPLTSAFGTHHLCCTGVADLVVNTVTPGTFVVGLSDPAGDAHIANNPASYVDNLYLRSDTNTITCGYSQSAANCLANYDTCLYGMAVDGVALSADSHVMACASSNYQTCCRATLNAAPSCTDSDGGINLNIQGTTIDSISPPISDTCAGGGITEYYCNSSNVTSVHTDLCPSGCALDGSGACAVPG